ncbi:CoxG family protein [Comamonas flocculans]|uniref:Carbon monoxide dehydrogenase subunit G n=1 Tax=Comamonas flocculans TaxID=2597701 RepID=A0A5B8RW29_9BURK|nr:carbon monoxide dehydrogenase subunit G [Comamonas flocculans]QEA12938.1 carbon monoxide dehydrogenase subunit G [Comamonas flocculans]
MEMQGSRPLAITQQQAWESLNDPEVLKACIPGCDSIEATGENAYAITMALKIGPVSARFKGNIALSDIEPPSSYTLGFEGSGGPAGFGKGSAKVTLTPQDAGCELSYSASASVGGKIAQVGQRLIDGVAKSMAEKFFTRFDEEMQRRFGPPPEDAGEEPREGGTLKKLWGKLKGGSQEDAAAPD